MIKEVRYGGLPCRHRISLDVNCGANSSLVVHGGVWTGHGDIRLRIDGVSLTAP